MNDKNAHVDELAIAIIGMAGRFPGAANLREFWTNLHDGKESIRFFTNDELVAAGVERDLCEDPGYVPAKGVLDDVDQFDAGFFGYSPREAEIIDPQQRIFLNAPTRPWKTPATTPRPATSASASTPAPASTAICSTTS